MKTSALNREILRLAIPSILANLTVPLVGMVDIAVAGHLTGSTAAFIGGISVGSVLFDLLYWSFAFIRTSTGGLVAQSFGREDWHECALIFLRSAVIALLLSVVILCIQWPFQKLAFLVVQSTPEVHDLALRYFLIRIWAAPATMSLMALRGWFVGMQDSVNSMAMDLVVNVVNIVSSIVLTLGVGSWKGLGFDGVAYGTLTAQYCGLAYGTAVIAFKYAGKVFKGIAIADLMSSFRGSEIRRFMTMNRDLFIRSLCFIAIYVGYTTIAARYGDLMLSASAILMKILMIFSFFVDGFAYAGEALVGRFIGARDFLSLRRCVRMVFAWALGVALLFMAVYGFGGEGLIAIMTSDAEVARNCARYLPWLLLMPVLGCAAFTWDGIYIGATAAPDIRNSMVAALVAFFGVWLAGWLLFPGMSEAAAIHLLMAAYFAHLLARTVVLSLCWPKTLLYICRI